MTDKDKIDAAFKIYCDETKGAFSSVNSWWDLSQELQKKYLALVTEDRITTKELEEWFGDTMPMEVFQFIFVDGAPDMTLKEAKEHVRQMAVEYRSPPSLSQQAYALLQSVKKNGNLPPILVKDINAWESRYFIWKREEDGRAKNK